MARTIACEYIAQPHKILAMPSLVSRDYIELAQPWSSLRLCRELQKKFPDFRGCQLELVRYLCADACKSEDYLDGGGDAWRRTTISLNSEYIPRHVYPADCPECDRMAEMMQLDGEERHIEYERSMQPVLQVVIQSNIVPRGAFLERLQEFELHWSLLKAVLMRTASCSVSNRGFFPKSILDQASEARNASLMEKVNEWRKENKGRCCLAKHLEDLDDCNPKCLTPRTALREIPIAEIQEVMLLGQGNEASVHQVLWGNRAYAKKKWQSETDFEKERNVALRVLHPNIVTAFGWSDNDDHNGKPVHCLLMEMMTEDLSRLAIKKDVLASNRTALLSRVDSLHVLLQVGMAMDYMHTKNVVHGDLKPDNILISSIEVSENKRYLLAKVTDFGCAQFFLPGQNLQMPGPIGTNVYSAPEVIGLHHGLEGGRNFQFPEKLDVYSFGAVAYEVLTGHKARYEGRSLKSRGDKKRFITGDLRLRDSKEWTDLIKEHRFPLELIKLVESCWELRPEDRPTFSDILLTIKKCKCTVKWEQRAAAIWRILVLLILFVFIYQYFI